MDKIVPKTGLSLADSVSPTEKSSMIILEFPTCTIGDYTRWIDAIILLLFLQNLQ
jgi:hypothetical protein